MYPVYKLTSDSPGSPLIQVCPFCILELHTYIWNENDSPLEDLLHLGFLLVGSLLFFAKQDPEPVLQQEEEEEEEEPLYMDDEDGQIFL